jgi:hypothetical protein
VPPKFEKIAAVGAPGLGTGFRYRVTVAPAAGGAGGKGKVAATAGRKGVLTAPRSFQLFADEVGLATPWVQMHLSPTT